MIRRLKVSQRLFDTILHTKVTIFVNHITSDHLKTQKKNDTLVFPNKFLYPDVYSCTKMIQSYVRNNRLDDALKVFDEMPVRDTVMWNSMIKGCIDCGNLEVAFKLFDEMPERNVVSWTTMVSGLLMLGRTEVAEQLFMEMPLKDEAAWNSMIHGYFVNGKVEEAVRLFHKMPSRSVISWTSMISGLDQTGKSDEALFIFKQMLFCGVRPTSMTFSSVLTACANVKDLRLGLFIHGNVVKLGYLSDVYITVPLITFYAHCADINSCCKVFYEKAHSSVVVWTSLLTGYSINCKHENALEVFSDMFRSNVLPNQSSFTSALNSCCELEALDRGKEINGAAVKLGLETDVFVGNSLIVLYTKCGNINDGLFIFKSIAEKNTVSWNSMIVGCAQHGYVKWALILFNQMIRNGVSPDDITFTGLLSACSRSGMLNKGRCIFNFLLNYKSVNVNLEHYACMVDILGRNGGLNEAVELAKNMPMEPNTSIWLALLSACKTHSNLKLAETAAEAIFNVDPNCSAAYTLLSNLYAFAGRWHDVSRIRGLMKNNGITKERGLSWVNLKGLRHEFYSGDKSHPMTTEIYAKLEWIGEKLKGFGYVPDQMFALHDVEDEQKETLLLYHSERLAICFALLCSVEGSTITVMKNLRVCGDCHSVIKLIAKIVKREIVVRDSSRFHHFKDGFCSCSDYW
ncbi:putative tetratricopeptide-like helical domain superfamily, DYW domain-containing protein [Helianthus anomalus]